MSKNRIIGEKSYKKCYLPAWGNPLFYLNKISDLRISAKRTGHCTSSMEKYLILHATFAESQRSAYLYIQ